MAKLVDATDLKSVGPNRPCPFESGRGHQGFPLQGVGDLRTHIGKWLQESDLARILFVNSTAMTLRADNVHVWRGARHVLRGVSFELRAGELLHVVGPNGAGKTTLLRVACGLLQPEEGAVHWCEQNIRQARTTFQSALAYAAHEAGLKADLTALENLHFSVGLRRSIDRQELMEYLERTDATDIANLPVRVLSAGQKRRVAMARVLACKVPLWLLDEPFSNLDDGAMKRTTELLEDHVRLGGAAVVVAHHGLALGSRRQLRLDA